jgi:hypothetical protein
MTLGVFALPALKQLSTVFCVLNSVFLYFSPFREAVKFYFAKWGILPSRSAVTRTGGTAARGLLRGASWRNNNTTNFRTAYRNRNTPDNINNNRGVRPARPYAHAESRLFTDRRAA